MFDGAVIESRDELYWFSKFLIVSDQSEQVVRLYIDDDQIFVVSIEIFITFN